MSTKTKIISKKLEEKTIKKLRKDFIKTIPQLQKIQKIQETQRKIQEKETEKLYPYIDTQSFSTV
ncbi:hypothetical protein AMJ47_01420 [Parcubacteria bacterium DG_72]|nr:MAG: hypothetical protein AMJ47_01420 [Parcubacteria bacterium DG_72]